ncbi:hypothetical protein BC830DRAFT_1164321 [Chytriomyces sp. MP71]|nr:hypothetical protein BC830DRAFT_1164321 [Chytriomyces sp. MP71]
MDNEERVRLILGAVVTCLASVLNILVVLCNLTYLRNLPPSSVLIVSLCISDFIFNTNEAVTTLLHLSGQRIDESVSSHLYQVQGAITTFAAILSILLVTGLTVFRYATVVLECNIRPQFTFIYISLCTATASLIVTFPFMIGQAGVVYVLHPTKISATVAWYDPEALWMSIACLVVIFIPITTIALAYFEIYRKATRVIAASRHYSASPGSWRVRATPAAERIKQPPHPATQETPSGLVLYIGAGKMMAPRQDSDAERQRNLLIQSIALVSCFILGWTPYVLFGMMEIFTRSPCSVEFEYAAEIVVALNDIASPCLALIFDKQLRDNTVRAFKARHGSG